MKEVLRRILIEILTVIAFIVYIGCVSVMMILSVARAAIWYKKEKYGMEYMLEYLDILEKFINGIIEKYAVGENENVES